MPAVSKQQQRLFGLALSVKRGDTPRSEVSDDVRKIVDTMSEKEIEKYAGTGHTGLPTKKEEVEELIRHEVRNYVRPVIGEGRAFINAARKAKEEGKTEFEFNGKTYPVTIKEGVLNEMTDLEYVGDQLVNGVGEGFMSRNEFVKLVGKETKYDKNTLGKIYDAYLKLDGRNRVKLDMTRNMDKFLKKMGLKEGLDENFTEDEAYNGLFRFKHKGQTYVGKVVRKDGGKYTLTIDGNSMMHYDGVSPKDMEYLGDASDQGKKGLPYLSAHPKNFKTVKQHDIRGKVLVFKDGVEVYLHPSFVKGKVLKDINKMYRLKLTQDDLKEGLEEAQKVPPQFISFLKMDYKNVKDTPRERKKLSKKLRKMPKDVLKQLADEDIGVLSSTSKELLGMSVSESVVNEASGEYVVYIERDNGRKKLLHTKKSQRAANMFMRKNMDKILNTSGVRSIGSMGKDQWEKSEAMYAENIKKSDMKTITKKEWDRKHKDFKGIVKGQPYMMYYDKDTQSTVYGPVNIKESVNEDTKKRFEVDFYKGNSDRQTSHEEIIRGDKFSDIVSQATKIAKSKGMSHVEFYYKDAFIGSIDKRNNYSFKKGRGFSKSPLSVNERRKRPSYLDPITLTMYNSKALKLKDLAKDFDKEGIKYDYTTKPFPHIIAYAGRNKKVAIVNNRHEFELDKYGIKHDTVIGTIMESTVNEVIRLTMSKPQMKQLHKAYGKLTYDQMKRMMLSLVKRDKFIKSLKKFDKKSLQQLVDMQPNSPFSKTVQSYIDGKIKEGVVNERKYSDQTGVKTALMREPQFSDLLSPKEQKWIKGNDVKIYKGIGMNFSFTDGKSEMTVNVGKPMSIVKKLGRASNEIKKVYQQNESVVNEKNVPKKGSPDYHQHKIAKDTVKNPRKSFMGGPSAEEAEETLVDKFGYTKKEIQKLKK